MWKWASNAGAWYARCLSHSPYITNSATGFIVAGAGDALCQRYFEQDKPEESKPIDKRRVLEMGLIRAAVITPFTLNWYTMLAKIAPGSTLLSALKRVVVDQAIGSPIVISLVFIAKAVFIGDALSAKDTIQRHLGPTWLVGLQYWPIMHTINFRFVPLLYQPLYATFASLYWNAVLSFYANKGPVGDSSTAPAVPAALVIPAGITTPAQSEPRIPGM